MPPGPGPTTDGCVVTGRLDRIPMNTTTGIASGAATHLITDWCQQFPSHSIGTLIFGADKMLYAGAGDGANFNGADWGQLGGTVPNTASPITPANPCADPGDPPNARRPRPAHVRRHRPQGGALRAQNVRHLAQPRLARRLDHPDRPALGHRARPPGQPAHRLGRPQQAADRGLRPPQPVPVPVPARDQRPVDRRRRLQHVGGAGPPADPDRPQRPDQLRLAVLREPRLRHLLQRWRAGPVRVAQARPARRRRRCGPTATGRATWSPATVARPAAGRSPGSRSTAARPIPPRTRMACSSPTTRAAASRSCPPAAAGCPTRAAVMAFEANAPDSAAIGAGPVQLVAVPDVGRPGRRHPVREPGRLEQHCRRDPPDPLCGAAGRVHRQPDLGCGPARRPLRWVGIDDPGPPVA